MFLNGASAALVFLCLASETAPPRQGRECRIDKERMRGIYVWDCSGLHNVGNLHMHVCNWGAFGSYPTWRWPISECPSAQWPANSGVEYLWIAGLWVGARKGGVPVVSTAAFDREFRPHATDPNNRIYYAFEGITGGASLPSPPDDDRDGLVDEDWQNGKDDDGDGRVDEDFAAISKQMYTCWFTDDQPEAIQVFPEHTPLHLFVRQQSYQWEEEQYYNIIGVEYRITNIGNDILEDVYIGFFADGDAGPRETDGYGLDDATGLFEDWVCARKGEQEMPVWVSCAYFYDPDGDEGFTTGYFGILFLGHDIDPLGNRAPRQVGITSYQNFSGEQTFEQGGDPTNDFQRYQLMSAGRKDRNQTVPRDYRMLMATGPFLELWPDSTLVLQVAFVCGEGLEGMIESAGNAAVVYDGNWFNIDGNPQTGVDGRETPVYGPATCIDPDSCDAETECLSAARGDVIWINLDCREEIEVWEDTRCLKGSATFSDYQTGVDGKETQVHWLVGSAPPPPNLRIVPGDHQVVLLWDNLSEVTPDVSTLELDFEGYRIWRADGWDRPLGTSVLSGPSRDLWHLLAERDYVNGIDPDVAFRIPFELGGWEYEPLTDLDNREQVIKMFEESLSYAPLDTVPCPPGLTRDVCDTIEALARYNLGLEGGSRYYKFVDRDVHNGMHYFYAVTAYDHVLEQDVPVQVGKFGDPSSNFRYAVPLSSAQASVGFQEREVYVVPNPATNESMRPWQLHPNMSDPTGIKVEFRNMPSCRSTVRIYTISGDLVAVLTHDGREGSGTLPWDLVSRNGQDVTSGVYLFSVEPEGGSDPRTIGKFVVIR